MPYPDHTRLSDITEEPITPEQTEALAVMEQAHRAWHSVLNTIEYGLRAVGVRVTTQDVECMLESFEEKLHEATARQRQILEGFDVDSKPADSVQRLAGAVARINAGGKS